MSAGIAQAYLVQIAETTVANEKAIPDWLARWRWMVRDRVDGKKISLTHKFLRR